MCPAIASGMRRPAIGRSNRLLLLANFFPCPKGTVPEVFTKVDSTQFPFRFYSGELAILRLRGGRPQNSQLKANISARLLQIYLRQVSLRTG